VAEQTGANVVSLAEHAVMCILNLLRNFAPSYKQVVDGEWDIAALAKRAYDLEGKTVGIFGAGQIGQLIAARLKPFGLAKVLYYKRTPLSIAEEENFGFRYSYFDDMLDHSDVIVIAAPQTPETKGIFDRDSPSRMKRGAWLFNIACGGSSRRTPSSRRLNKAISPGTRGRCGIPSPHPPTTHGKRCPTA
jgi:formate dehydrogenase